MLRYSLIFFVVGLLAYFLGANGVAGMSMNVGWVLLYVFVGLAVVSLIATLITGRKNKELPRQF